MSQIHGNGIDIIEIERVVRVVRRHRRRFLQRVYTARERAYCRQFAGKAFSARLAARFAAKEAVAKALGTGIRGFGWRDIEVVTDGGRPEVRLHAGAARTAEAAGVETILLSMTHGQRVAAAHALALTGAGKEPTA